MSYYVGNYVNPTCKLTSDSNKFALSTGNLGTVLEYNADDDLKPVNEDKLVNQQTSLAITNDVSSTKVLATIKKRQI